MKTKQSEEMLYYCTQYSYCSERVDSSLKQFIYCINIIIVVRLRMFGSLKQFLYDTPQQYQCNYVLTEPEQSHKPKSFSLNLKRPKTLKYETSDKTQILRNIKKVIRPNKGTDAILSTFQKGKDLKEKPQREHWVEKTSLSKQKMQHCHLLKAVITRKQAESKKTNKTTFDQCFDRVSDTFKKIRSQPTQTMVIDPLKSTPNIFMRNRCPQVKQKSRQLSPTRLLQYQNSVKWAKKHNKNFNSFYKNLGKSVELADKQRQGKNNFKLQQQYEHKMGELKRQKNRRQFLNRIEKKLSKQPKV